MTEHRPLRVIARDIEDNWPRVNYGAKPYLDAMFSLDSIDDYFYYDPASLVVVYFLANAATWRGEAARRIKAELKGML